MAGKAGRQRGSCAPCVMPCLSFGCRFLGAARLSPLLVVFLSHLNVRACASYIARGVRSFKCEGRGEGAGRA